MQLELEKARRRQRDAAAQFMQMRSMQGILENGGFWVVAGPSRQYEPKPRLRWVHYRGKGRQRLKWREIPPNGILAGLLWVFGLRDGRLDISVEDMPRSGESESIGAAQRPRV